MQILRSISELGRLPGPVFLAIGVFDGVHLGHQAVISTTAKHAAAAHGTAVVVTFDPHPARVLRPDKSPRLLTATQHKIELIRALGVSHLLVLAFDEKFAATSPEDFVRQLATACRPLREICVGREWSFGKDRAGNLALLKQLGGEFSFSVVGVEPVTVQGEVVSSSAIRRAVEAGEFGAAAEMLGRDYTILGTVEEGQHLGRELGFPTANVSAHSEQFPPNGVYAARARLDGVWLDGVANIGFRPTVSADSKRTLELHLFDLAREIYGAELEIKFARYLRGERKFENVEALKRQIELDAKSAREVFK
jgi:riboflavin kinase/FMN adenylyltransferase